MTMSPLDRFPFPRLPRCEFQFDPPNPISQCMEDGLYPMFIPHDNHVDHWVLCGVHRNQFLDEVLGVGPIALHPKDRRVWN